MHTYIHTLAHTPTFSTAMRLYNTVILCGAQNRPKITLYQQKEPLTGFHSKDETAIRINYDPT